MNHPRLLAGAGALALGAFTLGCEPIFAQIVVAAAPTDAAPGTGGRVIVREAWGRDKAPTAEIVVAGGSATAPLEGVEFTCEPRQTCSSHADLVQILEPTPGLQFYDITVAKAGFEPEHVKIDVAHARDLPFRRFFVMLKPRTDGAAR
jgi:hypothetical protein